MARMQRHHITYEPEWIVDVNMLMHRCVSRIQITKATPEAYAGVINYAHAITFEANRMRQELDTGLDLRQLKPKTKEDKKKEKRKVKKAIKKPDSFTKKSLKKAIRKIKRREPKQ